MNIVSLCPLRSAIVAWPAKSGAWMSTVVVKATFALRAGECALSEDQEIPNGEDSHWNDDAARSVYAPSDLAPFKRSPEFMLVGFAFSGSREPARSIVARLAIDDVEKALEVHCDRVLSRDGKVRSGAPFARVPVRYERASAGVHGENPVGLRMESTDGGIPIPNILPVGFLVSGPRDVPPPVGFGPLAEEWPERRRRLGAQPSTWLEARRRGHARPEDVDPAFFQSAPPDQWVSRLREDASIRLTHLHPDGPRFATRLPGIRARAFVDSTEELREIPLTCDTLWIDTDRLIATLTWRGATPALADASVFVAMDTARRPLSSADIDRMAREVRQTSGAAPRSMRPPQASSPMIATAGEALPVPSPRASSPDLFSPPLPPPESWRGAGREVRQADAEGTRVLDGSLDIAVVAPTPRSRAPSLHDIRQELGATSGGVEGARALGAGNETFPDPRPRVPVLAEETVGAATADAFPDDDVGLSTGVMRSKAEVARGPAWLKSTTEKSPRAPRFPADPAHRPPLRSEVPAAPVAVPVPTPAPQPAYMPRPTSGVSHPPSAAPVALRPAPPRPAVPPLSATSALQHQASAARAGVLGASNAAAEARADGGVVAPAAAPFTGDIIELLWFDDTSLPRVRRKQEWRALLDKVEEDPLDPDLDDPGGVDDPAEIEDRRDVFEIITRAEAAPEGEITRSLSANAVRSGGRFAPQMLLLSGELRFEFDEYETLRAVVSAAAPFAPQDADLRAAVEAATAFTSTPGLLAAPEVSAEMTRRVREAFARAQRPVPATYIEDQSERVLLEARAYQKRSVFGAPHLRSLFFVPGSTTGVPAYIPDEIGESLPLFRRLRVRLIAEAHFQADQYESHAAALRVVALARATRPV